MTWIKVVIKILKIPKSETIDTVGSQLLFWKLEIKPHLLQLRISGCKAAVYLLLQVLAKIIMKKICGFLMQESYLPFPGVHEKFKGLA